MSPSPAFPIQVFDEQKTAEAAAYLLQLAGGHLSYYHLLKLLYVSDRNALLKWACPITYDVYVSMDYGPVLSNTYRIISETYDESKYWQTLITPATPDHVVALRRVEEINLLSEAELAVLSDSFERYRNFSFQEFIDLTHDYPEWEDPHGSAIPFSIDDILLKNGKADSIEAAHEAMAMEAYLMRVRKAV